MTAAARIGRMPMGEYRNRLNETRDAQVMIEVLPISDEEKRERIAMLWADHEAREHDATDWVRLKPPRPTLRNILKLPPRDIGRFVVLFLQLMWRWLCRKRFA